MGFCLSGSLLLSQRGDDWILQQLLPNVGPQPAAGRHPGGFARELQAPAGPEATQGLCGRQAKEGWDQRGQPGLQQEDLTHRLAPAGKCHRRGNHQQPLHLPGKSELILSLWGKKTSEPLSLYVKIKKRTSKNHLSDSHHHHITNLGLLQDRMN